MLSNIELKNAKPKSKDYTLNADTGLTLLVKSTGSKLWRFRYSFSGKRCMISLGKYPQISLAEARAKQRECLDMLHKGINPSTHRQTQKAKLATERSFRDVALEWYAKRYQGSTERYHTLILQRMKKYLFPTIGRIPIKDIEAPMLFNIIEAIQEAGHVETGKRVNSYCSMVFRYGVAKGYCSRDFTQDYKGMLQNNKPVHMPTLTDTESIGELLRDMEAYNGTIVIKSALMVSAYVFVRPFVRPSELVNSKWEYIDFDTNHWIIPAKYMKMRRDHLIPFPSQVKAILETLLPITGSSPYIFPNEKDSSKPMHSESVNKTLRRIENGKYIGRMVSHGFRSMASTTLNEHKFRVIKSETRCGEPTTMRNISKNAPR